MSEVFTVTAFLVETVRSNVSHLLERQKRESSPTAASETGVKDRLPADKHAEPHETDQVKRFFKAAPDDDLVSYARLRAEIEGLTAAERAEVLSLPEAAVRALDALARTA
jgi:DNA-directed RNA polymerase specialized sigma24 family protein